MVVEVISENTPTARKDHNCMASEWLTDSVYSLSELPFTYKEKRAMALARKNRWKIKKGDKYLRATCKCEGELYTWKAIPAIHDICLNYDIFSD